MRYQFQNLQLKEAEKLWLEKVLEKDFQKFKVRDLKIELGKKLPKEFYPEKIDFRICSGNCINLIGLWYVEPKHHLFTVVKKIIHHIKDELSTYKDKEKIESSLVASKINESKKDTAIAFYLMNSVGLLNGGNWFDGMYGFETASFNGTNKAFDNYIHFESIEEVLEDYFIENNRSSIRNEIEIINYGHSKSNYSYFIEPERINALKALSSKKFDFKKLVRLCEELNVAKSSDSYFSIIALTRIVIDHVPPIFGFRNFNEVANNYGGSSVKKAMNYMAKEIANVHLHIQIRKVESLPNFIQVNFSQPLDLLLSEIVRKIQEDEKRE